MKIEAALSMMRASRKGKQRQGRAARPSASPGQTKHTGLHFWFLNIQFL